MKNFLLNAVILSFLITPSILGMSRRARTPLSFFSVVFNNIHYHNPYLSSLHYKRSYTNHIFNTDQEMNIVNTYLDVKVAKNNFKKLVHQASTGSIEAKRTLILLRKIWKNPLYLHLPSEKCYIEDLKKYKLLESNGRTCTDYKRVIMTCEFAEIEQEYTSTLQQLVESEEEKEQ